MSVALSINQNFIPGWNAIYQNLINKVAKSIIQHNEFSSPFSQMLQDMEVGQYVEDIHINPGHVMLHDTMTNSDILTDYIDDIATSVYEVNVDLVFPSTYKEYVVRTAANFMENVTSLITAITRNIRTTLEFRRNELVKQMLFNGVKYGMIERIQIADPTANAVNAANFAIKLNTTLDDFRTEINPRNVIFNKQIGLTDDDYRMTIANETPYIIIFNEYIRYVEFVEALKLGLVSGFSSGNSNQDWQERLIFLNQQDFPNSIPTINRSEVTGQNVSAANVNFYEMPTDKDGNPIFEEIPDDEDFDIYGFVIEPSAIKLFTQLSIVTSWLNPATQAHTNREIYRGIMALGAFNKICAITS